jgi:hypothetical protein
MTGQHPRPVGILGRAEDGREEVGRPELERAVGVLLLQDVLGTHTARQLEVALAAGGGAQQVVEQDALAVVELAQRHADTGVERGGKVAPGRARRVAHVRVLHLGELVGAEAAEEGAGGGRHLPAAARGEGDITGPRTGLGRCCAWG